MEGEAPSSSAPPTETNSQPLPQPSTEAAVLPEQAPEASGEASTNRPDATRRSPSTRAKGQPDGTPAREGEDAPQYTATVATTRRNANGSISSVYSGNRIRYLKKEDGQPFWRRDIQFLFLKTVFEDQTKVFTKASTGSTGHTFAEIYVDAMAKSSKCSQILKDKLMADQTSAVDMAMICLLVNVGRMNTTLNFFPEMRARVRTYHAIPCLQAQQGANAYKQLQDGPRLKSILKGATEDTPQPSSIEEIVNHSKPRTNPVNLIFVFSQFAPKISELHFPPPRDFFDLFMRPTLSSKSRAKAFLWLIWWYLESDFSNQDAVNNPFGAGEVNEKDPLAVKVPPLELLTDEQADSENIDTEEELAYGEAKRLEREAIVLNDMPPTNSSSAIKNRSGKALTEHQQKYRQYSPNGSESDPGHYSPSPPHTNQRSGPGSALWQVDPQGASIRNATSDPQTTPSSASRRGPGRGNYPRKPKEHALEAAHNHHPPLFPAPSQTPVYSFSHAGTNGAASSPPANGSYTPGAEGSYFHQSSGMDPPGSGHGDSQRRKIRSHVTVEQQRRQRVDLLLYEKTKQEQSKRRKERREKGALMDAWIRCLMVPDGWDSEDDELHRMGGIDDLKKNSRPVNSLDETDPSTARSFGDVGFRAKSIAQVARRIARSHDRVPISRPPRVRNSRRGIYSGAEDAQLKDGGTPTAASLGPVPVVHTARMAIDDPRRKRPYKPRAKRNLDMQPQTSRLDATPGSGIKRKRGGGVAKGSRGGRGRGGRGAGATRPGESVQSMTDFLGPGTPGGDGDDKSEIEGSRADGEEQSMLDHEDDGDVDMHRGDGEDDGDEGEDGDETEDMDDQEDDDERDDDEGDTEDDDMEMDEDEPAD